MVDEIDKFFGESNYSLDKNGTLKSKTGKFVKGVSGNPHGRPKGTGKRQKELAANKDITPEEIALFNEIVKEADGDGVMFQKLVLKNAHRIRLDLPKVQATFKLAQAISNYQTPKKTSIETKSYDFKQIQVHMVLPETMRELESIYKHDKKLIDHISDEDLQKVQENTFNAEKFVDRERESAIIDIETDKKDGE